MNSTKIELRQTKLFVGPMRFGVRHQVLSASPALLACPLVIDLSASPYDKERFVEVVTLSDLVRNALTDGRSLPVKPLNTFFDGSVSLAAQPSDVLAVENCPPEWGDSPQTFSVRGPDDSGRGLLITDAFWWSVPEPTPPDDGLSWVLQRGGTTVATGTRGYTARQGGDGLCRADRFMAVFSDAESALDHMTAVATYLNSLATSVGLDGAQFERFPPGNPVDSTFPG